VRHFQMSCDTNFTNNFRTVFVNTPLRKGYGFNDGDFNCACQ
jgi:hypothetical protein